MGSTWPPEALDATCVKAELAQWVMQLENQSSRALDLSPSVTNASRLKSGPCPLLLGLRNAWPLPTSQSGYQEKPTVCTEFSEQLMKSMRLQGSGKLYWKMLFWVLEIDKNHLRSWGSRWDWGLDHSWLWPLFPPVVGHHVHLFLHPNFHLTSSKWRHGFIFHSLLSPIFIAIDQKYHPMMMCS